MRGKSRAVSLPPTREHRIGRGSHLLPWFHLPPPGWAFQYEYYESAIKKAAKLDLPLQWRPDPSLVLFLSNNERPRLGQWEAEESSEFETLYGQGKSDVFKRKVIGDARI